MFFQRQDHGAVQEVQNQLDVGYFCSLVCEDKEEVDKGTVAVSCSCSGCWGLMPAFSSVLYCSVSQIW